MRTIFSSVVFVLALSATLQLPQGAGASLDCGVSQGQGSWVSRIWARAWGGRLWGKSAQDTPLDLARVGRKRGREKAQSTEGLSGGSTGSSKRVRGYARGKLDLECTICGKASTTSSHLNVHMRTHSGDRPHSCTTCDKAFSTSSDLTKHTRTHTGDRPYVCATCGSTFARSDSLTVHVRAHTGDRPYPCTTCGKAFLTSSHLGRHRKKLHVLDSD